MRDIFMSRYVPKLGVIRTRKLGVRSKIFLCSLTVQDYGNLSADICLVMQTVGQAGHSLSLLILQSLCNRSA